jgi:hypothetical protein
MAGQRTQFGPPVGSSKGALISSTGGVGSTAVADMFDH